MVHLYFKSFSLLWWFENWIVTQIISQVSLKISLFFIPNALPQVVAKTLRYILPLVVLFLFLFIWKSLSLLIIREIWLMRTYRWELFANWISTIQSSPGTIRRQCEESISNKAWCLKPLMKGSLTCRAQSHPPLLDQIPEVVRKHREKDPSISSLSTCAGYGGRDPGCLNGASKRFPGIWKQESLGIMSQTKAHMVLEMVLFLFVLKKKSG